MAITFKWRRGTASSWSSTNPTLNAGEPGLETDTGRLKVGTGSAAWNSLSYLPSGFAQTSAPSNVADGTVWLDTDGTLAEGSFVSNTIMDAKGDVLAASAADTPARLAVGSNDQVLVADSSTSTGLAWKSYGAQQVAGKNKLLNGDFSIWQRGTSTTLTNAAAYVADRWYGSGSNTYTISKQTSTPPSGIDSYARVSYGAASSFCNLFQAMESIVVRSVWGMTVTASFYARRNSTYANGLVLDIQTGTVANTLTGGTWTSAASVTVSNANLPTGTGSSDWVRASVSYTVPYGTLGLRIRIGEEATQASGAYYEVTGVQLEAGGVATLFSTATGNPASELAACQRYYYRQTSGAAGQHFANGNNQSTTVGVFLTQFPVTMRTAPTALEQSGTAGDYSIRHQATSTACYAVPAHDNASVWGASYTFTVASGLTAGNGSFARPVNTSAYLGWSAEL